MKVMFRIIYPNRWFVWTIVIAVVIAVGLYWYFMIQAIRYRATSANLELERQIFELKKKRIGQVDASTSLSTSTADWKTYIDETRRFEFQYPEKLKLIKNGNKVILNHYIPYENYGDCDMIGGNRVYKTLDDFNVSFEVVPQKLALNYVDGEYNAGILKGFWAYEGAEGCGHSTYYFPIEQNRTLVVYRSAVQALSGSSTLWDLEKILKIPGVIPREESEKIFNEILSTFKFIQ